MMNLYLLTRDGERYDEAEGFVVRAPSELAARGIIAGADWDGPGDEGRQCWLDPKQTACEELAENVEGASEIILRDFRAG